MRILRLIGVLLAVASALTACGGGGDPEPNGKDDVNPFSISVPASITVTAGDDVSVNFYSGKGPTVSDKVVLRPSTGTAEVVIAIKSVASSAFVFTVPSDLQSGNYSFCLRRGTHTWYEGKTDITVLSGSDVTPKEDCNVYGKVTCDGAGVPGVQVSDGISITETDSEGNYYLKSSEKWRVVFMTIPSGYEAPLDGILPQFSSRLDGNPSTRDRVDFTLNKVAGQEDYVVYFLGDMHLAGRGITGDVRQFKAFEKDLNTRLASVSGKRQYAVTLGDMTWDLYWYDNSYQFPEYLKEMNSAFKGLPVFHTMGNHDNDMRSVGDFNAATLYVRDIAPTYYAFNIGEVHYIVLDNIFCTNDGTGSRTFDYDIPQEEYSWLRQDLAHVDKDTPIIVTMHAPVFRNTTGTVYDFTPDGYSDSGKKNDFSWTAKIDAAFDGYKTVHIVSGHTHRVLNVPSKGVETSSRVPSDRNYFEHNSGAICASWWWSAKLTPGLNIGTDGAPGGYAIWNVNGKNIDWTFKGTGRKADYQFRAYDLNNVCFDTGVSSGTWLPDANSWALQHFQNDFGKYFPKNSDNEVLINVWNYDPSWKIKVVEKTADGDRELTPVQTRTLDPLHIAALTAKRYDKSDLSSAPSFTTVFSPHFFKVKCSSASTTLVISVTDGFGNTSTQTMTRPRAFSTDEYRTEGTE